ncbi:MAG: hypothetical protein P4N59_06440 [Negativicutes bacterium]|nr:hypothetical protein [Negativicutes bacterium]
MAGELNNPQGERIVDKMAEIRDGSSDSTSRRERREYQKFVRKTKSLEALRDFSYTEFDYAPHLERQEFIPLPTPDYGYLVTDAEAKAKADTTYRSRLTEIALAVGLGIALDVIFINLTGILSLLCLAGGGMAVHHLLEKRRRAILRAMEIARLEGVRLVAEFEAGLDKAREDFLQEQDERIKAIENILSGIPSAILTACEIAASQVEVPFFLRGRIELAKKEPVIHLELPDIHFVPTAEWEESKTEGYRVIERTPTAINRQYAEATTSALFQVALRILERVPSLEELVINGFTRGEGGESCRMSVRVKREDIPLIVAADSGVTLMDQLGNIHVLTGASLAAVDAVAVEWTEKAVGQEILRSSICVSYQATD